MALGLGFYVNSIKESYSKTFLIITAGVIFTLFGLGIHGLIAHSLNPKATGGILAYPLLMGALLGVSILFILPIFYPDFLLEPW